MRCALPVVRVGDVSLKRNVRRTQRARSIRRKKAGGRYRRRNRCRSGRQRAGFARERFLPRRSQSAKVGESSFAGSGAGPVIIPARRDRVCPLRCGGWTPGPRRSETFLGRSQNRSRVASPWAHHPAAQRRDGVLGRAQRVDGVRSRRHADPDLCQRDPLAVLLLGAGSLRHAGSCTGDAGAESAGQPGGSDVDSRDGGAAGRAAVAPVPVGLVPGPLVVGGRGRGDAGHADGRLSDGSPADAALHGGAGAGAAGPDADERRRRCGVTVGGWISAGAGVGRARDRRANGTGAAASHRAGGRGRAADRGRGCG